MSCRARDAHTHIQHIIQSHFYLFVKQASLWTAGGNLNILREAMQKHHGYGNQTHSLCVCGFPFDMGVCALQPSAFPLGPPDSERNPRSVARLIAANPKRQPKLFTAHFNHTSHRPLPVSQKALKHTLAPPPSLKLRPMAAENHRTDAALIPLIWGLFFPTAACKFGILAVGGLKLLRGRVTGMVSLN